MIWTREVGHSALLLRSFIQKKTMVVARHTAGFEHDGIPGLAGYTPLRARRSRQPGACSFMAQYGQYISMMNSLLRPNIATHSARFEVADVMLKTPFHPR